MKPEELIEILVISSFTSLDAIVDWLDAARRGAIQQDQQDAPLYAALHALAKKAEEHGVFWSTFLKFLSDNSGSLTVTEAARLRVAIPQDQFPLEGDHLWSRYLTSDAEGNAVWEQREPGKLEL